jgi:hypothetical protein
MDAEHDEFPIGGIGPHGGELARSFKDCNEGRAKQAVLGREVNHVHFPAS